MARAAIERLGTSVDLRTGTGDFSGLLFLGLATTNIVPNGLVGHFAGTITLHSNIFPAPVGAGTAGCGGGVSS
jgi:hypothetical protein